MVRLDTDTQLTCGIRVNSSAVPFAPSLLVGIALLAVACTDNAPTGATTTSPATASQWFTDVTDEVGLDFVHQGSPIDELHLPAISAGGAAFLDWQCFVAAAVRWPLHPAGRRVRRV